MCNIVRFPARQYEVSVYIIVFCLICVFEIRTKKNKQTKYKTPNKTFRLSFFFSFFCLDSFVFFKIFLFWFEFRSVCGYWRRIDLNITNNSRHSDFGFIPRRMVMIRGWRGWWRRVGDGETARQISRRRRGCWRADGCYRRFTTHHGLSSFNTARTATNRLLLLLMMSVAASVGVWKGRTWSGTVIRVPCKVMTICSKKRMVQTVSYFIV